MADIKLKFQSESLSEKLKSAGLDYLKVSVRGNSVSVFSEYEGTRENRCRFTNIGGLAYELSIADHNGKWQPTPFDGTFNELVDIVMTDFEWILTDYKMNEN